MAINLHLKYDKKIQEAFSTASLLKNRLGSEYSFTGAKSVRISQPLTVPMVDYTRSGTNRYGEPTEMQDMVQEMTMTQDKSFAMTIDKGNNLDQHGIKQAGKMLNLQIRERATPLMDTYGFLRLAHLAGKVVGNTAALTKTNVLERIAQGTLHMDDAEVPQENRTLFVPNSVYLLMKHSDQFLALEGTGVEALRKGLVGRYDNMDVIKVPAVRWPANVNFLIVYKNAALLPVKLNDTKLHTDPPGLSGNLLEGRQYYDLFVLSAKADGVYAEIDTAAGKGSVLANLTINASTGAITGASAGATVKYTTDGTDPRYSISAQVGTAPALASGTKTTVKAYQYSNDGKFPSGVTSVEVIKA